MFKKIVTFSLLVLHLTFSSGLVVFAFECECSTFKHSHFSLLKNVYCSDFNHEDNTHNNLATSCNYCSCNHNYYNNENYNFDNHFKQNENSQLNLKQLIQTKCGNNTIKIFKLGVDAIQAFAPSFKFIPEFSQIDLLLLKTTYHFINQTFNNIFLTKTKLLEKNISKYSQLLIVKYIHNISNIQSDDTQAIA